MPSRRRAGSPKVLDVRFGHEHRTSASGFRRQRQAHPYYEEIGLLPEAGRTGSGYRIYTPHEVNILRFVKRARTLGFDLERIQYLVGLWWDKDRDIAEFKRIELKHVTELEAQNCRRCKR